MKTLGQRLHVTKGPVYSGEDLTYFPITEKLFSLYSPRSMILKYLDIFGMSATCPEIDEAATILFGQTRLFDFECFFAIEEE